MNGYPRVYSSVIAFQAFEPMWMTVALDRESSARDEFSRISHTALLA